MIRLTQTGKQAWVMRAAASEGLGFPDLEANLGTRPAAGRVVQPELSSGTPGAGFRGEGGSVGSGGDLPPSFLPHCPPPPTPHHQLSSLSCLGLEQVKVRPGSWSVPSLVGEVRGKEDRELSVAGPWASHLRSTMAPSS